VAGRPLRVSKRGGIRRRRIPGDMERKGLTAAAGPVRSPRAKSRRETRLNEKTNRDFSWVKNLPESVDCSHSGVIVTYNTDHPGQEVHHEPDAPKHETGGCDHGHGAVVRSAARRTGCAAGRFPVRAGDPGGRP